MQVGKVQKSSFPPERNWEVIKRSWSFGDTVSHLYTDPGSTPEAGGPVHLQRLSMVFACLNGWKKPKEEGFVTYESCVDSSCSVQRASRLGHSQVPFHLLALPLGAPGQSWVVVTDYVAASLECLLFGLSRNGMLSPNVDSCICLDLVLKPVYNQGSERKQSLS